MVVTVTEQCECTQCHSTIHLKLGKMVNSVTHILPQLKILQDAFSIVKHYLIFLSDYTVLRVCLHQNLTALRLRPDSNRDTWGT